MTNDTNLKHSVVETVDKREEYNRRLIDREVLNSSIGHCIRSVRGEVSNVSAQYKSLKEFKAIFLPNVWREYY